MGRGSVKENKNIFQIAREEYGAKYKNTNTYSREKASELLKWISEDRLERIENEGSVPRPDEVYQMSQCYKKPELCNQFCTEMCEIGKNVIPKIEIKNIERIVIELLGSLTGIEEKKNKLIEITSDGVISEEEFKELEKIEDQLEKISVTVSALELWLEKTKTEYDKSSEK